jgi:hypothetical protein
MTAEKKYTAGPDVDLHREDVRDSKGRRITTEYAERAAKYDPATVTRRGRKSLTGGDGHSPRVSFRVTAEVQARAEAVAAARGQTVSALAREALERYLAS